MQGDWMNRYLSCNGIMRAIILNLIVFGLFSFILFHLDSRNNQQDNSEILFEGIIYTRITPDSPRPIIAHIVRVDLDAPDIAFLVTPNTLENGERITARTTSQFLDEFDLQLAINGGFFGWTTENEPESGDILTIHGLTASQGLLYTTGYTNPIDYNTVYISEDNRVEFNTSIDTIYNALSGYGMIVDLGIYQPIENPPEHNDQLHPRTAIALNENEDELLFVLVDGRQPDISEGVTIPELAQIIIDAGGYTALNLDGGGSVTLTIEDENGEAQLLNTPVSADIIGRERPIANHLGIYARRLGE